jgi:hypothetical protein
VSIADWWEYSWGRTSADVGLAGAMWGRSPPTPALPAAPGLLRRPKPVEPV